ncbi:MAG: trehalase family glycosidase [bacterium]|nr:trehalase family glycosidase [bacterium]
MDYLKLLQRTDYYEISGNRMTSYCSTLGGGSINYWDGKRASFHPYAPLCDTTAFVQVLDAENRVNLVQQMYHFWRPDRISGKYHSHNRTYIEEEKTIHDDTFVSLMDFHTELDTELIVRIEGAVGQGSSVRFEDNVLLIEEIRRSEFAESESSVCKIMGFDRPCRCRVEGNRYTLEFDLKLSSIMPLLHAGRTRAVLIVAGGDTPQEALDRYNRAAADPAAVFSARKRKWEEYFERNVPRFSCDNQTITKMYYFIYYMVKSNIYNFDGGPFLNHPFESTGKFRLLPQWFWDSAFGAMNEKWLNDLPLPKSSMSNTLEAQREDGLLPFSLAEDSFVNWGTEIIQPFILPMAVWDYYLKSGDRAFLDKALPVLIKFDQWMIQSRDENGEDLVNIRIPGESGWDNSKRYVLNEHLAGEESPLMREKRYVQSPDFNTYVYIGRRLIARMARETGQAELAEEYTAKADKTGAGIESMWSDKTGLYMDRFERDHEEIPVRTPGGVIPLLGGLGDEERRSRAVRNLTDPELFWPEYPVTTLDLQDPDYNDTDEYFSYWNGRVWPPVNWVITEGLCRAGEYETAGELIKRSIRMCSAAGEAWCMENYHPQTGYPYFTHNIFNYVWGGIFNDMLLRRVAGIQGNAPKDEVYINPLLNEDINELSLKDIRIGVHSIDMELSGDRDNICLKVGHRGPCPITLVTSNGRQRLSNESVTLTVKTLKLPHWLDL